MLQSTPAIASERCYRAPSYATSVPWYPVESISQCTVHCKIKHVYATQQYCVSKQHVVNLCSLIRKECFAMNAPFCIPNERADAVRTSMNLDTWSLKCLDTWNFRCCRRIITICWHLQETCRMHTCSSILDSLCT